MQKQCSDTSSPSPVAFCFCLNAAGIHCVMNPVVWETRAGASGRPPGRRALGAAWPMPGWGPCEERPREPPSCPEHPEDALAVLAQEGALPEEGVSRSLDLLASECSA